MSPPRLWAFSNMLLLLFIWPFSTTFKKAEKARLAGDHTQARHYYEKVPKLSRYHPAAAYRLADYERGRADDVASLVELHETFYDLEKTWKRLSPKQKRKLKRRAELSEENCLDRIHKVENEIVKLLCKGGTLAELDTVFTRREVWKQDNAKVFEDLRKLVVNKTVNPKQGMAAECCAKQDWEGPKGRHPSLLSYRDGQYCAPLVWHNAVPLHITYEEVGIIADRFKRKVVPGNYPAFWGLQDDIFDLFLLHHSFCELDRFKEDYPEHFVAEDCWFDQAKDTLCLGQLRPLLAFRLNNPHTALDIYVCNQIICLASSAPEQLDQLNEAERQQLEDVELIARLHEEMTCPSEARPPAELAADVLRLAHAYPEHKSLYQCVQQLMIHLVEHRETKLARETVDALLPLLTDRIVCNPVHDFQAGKQTWLQDFDEMAKIIKDSVEAAILPAVDWNTATNHEYALTSWGSGEEVFFARRDTATNRAKVMVSRRKDGKWTRPAVVSKLSSSDDIMPLSISHEGLLMLLRANGTLLTSQRINTRSPWSQPEPIALGFSSAALAGRAALSADAEQLFFTIFDSAPSLTRKPGRGIVAEAQRDEDGSYQLVGRLDTAINAPLGSQADPLLVLDGRLFCFVSDRPGGLGKTDAYLAPLGESGDWESLGQAVNLGPRFNSFRPDEGLTFYCAYTNEAYFDRKDKCTGIRNIWRAPNFSDQAEEVKVPRLTGVVLDQDGKPISVGKGFVEFTVNQQPSVRSAIVANNGTYTFIPPKDAETVRIFIEVPGYYSDHDTTHFINEMEEGAVIQDTFVLFSFEHLQQHFKLQHCQFENGTAEFQESALAAPELIRLADMATRMGAELHFYGHTDNTGTEANNKGLSLARADAVKALLVSTAGFDPERVKTKGMGDSQPLCPNNTEEGRQCNRRVEVVFERLTYPVKAANTEASRE